MKLFLTSDASKTLEKIVPLLPKSPQGTKVAFIPTAADPYPAAPWMQNDRNKLKELGFTVFDFDLKNKSEAETRETLTNADIVFVAGGNTFYLLEKANRSGFTNVIKDLVNKGTIYIGSSAGSVITGPDIEPVKVFDDPKAAQLNSTDGFHFIDFVILPHYGEKKRLNTHKAVVNEYKDTYKLQLLTDEQFVLVEDKGFKILG